MATKESEFLSWLKNGCEANGAYFRKIPDMPFRTQSKKPFDAIMIIGGTTVLIEAKKKIVMGGAVPKLYYTDFRPNQWEELCEEVTFGIHAMVMANFAYSVRGSRKTHATESFLFPFKDVVHYKQTFQGSKGVPLGTISDNGFPLTVSTVQIEGKSKKSLWFTDRPKFDSWLLKEITTDITSLYGISNWG